MAMAVPYRNNLIDYFILISFVINWSFIGWFNAEMPSLRFWIAAITSIAAFHFAGIITFDSMTINLTGDGEDGYNQRMIEMNHESRLDTDVLPVSDLNVDNAAVSPSAIIVQSQHRSS